MALLFEIIAAVLAVIALIAWIGGVPIHEAQLWMMLAIVFALLALVEVVRKKNSPSKGGH